MRGNSHFSLLTSHLSRLNEGCDFLERLQKVMAHGGVASRRRCEELIAAGEVQVNGRVVTEPGYKVDLSKDTVLVFGERLGRGEKKYYIALYKPRGYVSTVADDKGRKTVMALLPEIKVRVYPVGRLDYSSEGLLLLTNDGDLAYTLTHPKHKIPKTYLVKVKGAPSEKKLAWLAQGVPLADGITAPAKVRLLEKGEGKSLLEITLYEGRNRQIRQMCEFIDHPVTRLTRTRVANIRLADLRPGQYRFLTAKELQALTKLINLPTSNLKKEGISG